MWGVIKEERRMDRVALIACLWFTGWTFGGTELAKWAFNAPLSGGIWGFVLALLTVFLWPWLMPRAVEDWMHGSHS
jgi:Na+/proline symporter